MEESVAMERMDEQLQEGEEEEEEDMEHTASNHHPSAPTAVIVSVSSDVDSNSSRAFTSPSRLSTSLTSYSPIFQVVSPDHHMHHILSKKHLQVRQTLSEPGRNGCGHKVKVARLSPTRLSPLQHRKNDLSKTLSMGATLENSGSSPSLWKPVVESTGQHMTRMCAAEPHAHVGVVSGAEAMQAEGGEESPSSMPSVSPLTLPPGTRIPFMTGVGGQIPTQEQLEALYKQLPSNSEQVDCLQKQMLAIMEQQKKMAGLAPTPSLLGATPSLKTSTQVTPSTGTTTTVPASSASPGGTEMMQFPLVLLGVSPYTAFPPAPPSSSTSSNSSATPSPTSTTSNDSGISGANLPPFPLAGLSLQPSSLSTTSREPLSLAGNSCGVQQRRPLSESLSAPGFQSAPEPSFEVMQKQFHQQQQQLLVQSQQIHQHFLDQQQRLMQQAVLERKQFEDQQRQLSAMHIHQQSELQKKQQLLRQMQEAHFLTIQRQQQMLLLHQSLQQQQQQQQRASQLVQQTAPSLSLTRRAQTSPQPSHKSIVHRHSMKDSSSLPYSKSPLSTSTSSNSLHDTGDFGASRGVVELHGGSRSPSLTPKASLTPTNSYESGASNNGRLSPNIGVASPSSGQEPPQQMGTGLVYDSMMLKHGCSCGGSHPEHPGRLQSIWARLIETRVVSSCRRLRARKASLAELQSIHSENHVRLYGRPSQRKAGIDKKESGRAFVQLSCGGLGVDRDTYWNDVHTSNASRMAVGSVIELADKVASGEVKNGFAFVRPPGHHALQNQAQAFCYFNNVALATKAMHSKGRKVMVVDWDIHHGNGTQQMFYDNPNVLFMSIHRYDNGTFFPGTGRPDEIGSGAGIGFNVNIAFSGATNYQGMSVSNFGDAEYLAAFRSIVVPIGREFGPDLILVSAGFNATEGHPPTLGGYSLSPNCYAHMTRLLMGVGSGRVAMALEGGYELMSLCASAELCMKALLGLDLLPLDAACLERSPHPAAQTSLEKTIAYHKNYWRCLAHSAHLVSLAHMEAEKRELEEADTVSALASLSVGGDPRRLSAAMQTSV